VRLKSEWTEEDNARLKECVAQDASIVRVAAAFDRSIRNVRIAKGSYCRARCSQKQGLAQIAKSGGLRFRSELLAVLVGGCQCWRFLTRTRLRYAQPH
jgi:hypothetical protein